MSGRPRAACCYKNTSVSRTATSCSTPELTKTEACVAIAVRQGIAVKDHPKVTIADPRCLETEIKLAEKILKIRSVYLRPESTRLEQPDDMIIFEKIDDNTICAGGINCY